MINYLQNLDLYFLEYLQSNFQSVLNDKIFRFITVLGDKGFIWVVIALILIIGNKHRRTGILVILALLLASLVGEVLIKNIVQRPRPFVEYRYLKSIISYTSGYSFPSGHTVSSFAAARILSSEFKKYRCLFFGLAFAIAFSRLYLLVHYPTDIAAGIIIGFICGWIILKANTKITTNNIV